MPTVSKLDKEMYARADLHSLEQAEKIKKDPGRVAAVRSVLKEQQELLDPVVKNKAQPKPPVKAQPKPPVKAQPKPPVKK